MTGLLTYCGCCCIAAFIFIIAMAAYSIARGGMFIRAGNVRMRPTKNSRYHYEAHENVQKLEAIRSNEKVTCEKCGAWADAGDRFCHHCGAPIERK